MRVTASRALLATAILLMVLLPACASEPVALRPVVQERYPHDQTAFTQGLVWFEGLLYESTGLYGASSLREVDPLTGEVLRVRHLDSSLFGEGLARVGDDLIQLTWQAGRAFVYRLDTFEPVETFRYDGEGWGLCFDGTELWMSDGSASLSVRNPRTFEQIRQLSVKLDGVAVRMLNELECVGDHVYANVWQTDRIVRIDKRTGRVDGVIDASGLLSAEEAAVLNSDAVLNGIAYDEENERFLITGKLWPALFAVHFE